MRSDIVSVHATGDAPRIDRKCETTELSIKQKGFQLGSQ